MKHLKLFVSLSALLVAAVGCGIQEESASGGDAGVSARRERNAEIAPFELVNGGFGAGAGGWTTGGVPVSAGCSGPSGAPSMGVWQKNALNFGFSKTMVSQTVRVVNPSTVTFRVIAAVRADQPDAVFTISLSSVSGVSTTGPQTGTSLVTPAEFSLSVATKVPNESVTVWIEGASSKFWAGCYGPIITNARLTAVPTMNSTSTSVVAASVPTAPQTTLPTVSTTSPPAGTPSGGSSSTTSTTSTIAQPTTTSLATTTSVTSAVPSTTTSVKPAVTVSVAAPSSVVVRDCKLVAGGTCKGVAALESDQFLGSLKLEYLNASGSSFTDVSEIAANFRQADLHQSNFEEVDLSRSNFTDANLVGARLAGARFGDDAEEVSNYVSAASLRYARLDHADLSRVTFGSTSLQGASLVGANLQGASLRGARLNGADLRGADLRGARTNGLVASGVKLSPGYVAVGASILGPQVNVSAPRISEWIGDALLPFAMESRPTDQQIAARSCQSLAFYSPRSSRTFEEKEQDYAKLERSKLRRAKLDGLDLTGVNFDGLELSEVSFVNANLAGASFRGANLSGANFKGATLTNVDMSGANVTSVDFRAAREFANVRSGCTFTTEGGQVTLPKGWRLDQTVASLQTDTNSRKAKEVRSKFYIVNRGLLLGPTAILAGVNLAGVNLDSIDLSSAVLSDVSTASADCVPIVRQRQSQKGLALPNGYQFSNDVLFGPEVDLCGANLSNLNLHRLDLSSANLASVQSGGVKGSPILPSGWALAAGYLVGPGVALSRVDLSTADLSNVNFEGALLDSVNLSRAKLAGASGVELRDVKSSWPKGYAVRMETLFGPDVDLSGVVVAAENFPDSERSLTGVDLTRAKLDNVALSGFIGNPDLPRGWVLADGYLVGPTARLEDRLINVTWDVGRRLQVPEGYVRVGDRLVGRDVLIDSVAGAVENVDLTGATIHPDAFQRAQLANVRGIGISPAKDRPRFEIEGMPIARGWEVTRRGTIVGPSADLTGVDLEGDRINITDLSKARLDRVHAVRVIVREPEKLRLPAGWRYAGGMFLGKTADLSGADLSDLVLNDDLSGAILTGAFGSKITGKPKLPAGWAIRSGFLIGPEADIVCTSLGQRDLAPGQFGRFGAYFDPGYFGVSRPSRPLC